MFGFYNILDTIKDYKLDLINRAMALKCLGNSQRCNISTYKEGNVELWIQISC